MPSSDRLFWISRWPAPLKLRPISLLRPPRTPGVVLARLQTFRPASGSSTMERWLIVSGDLGRVGIEGLSLSLRPSPSR